MKSLTLCPCSYPKVSTTVICFYIVSTFWQQKVAKTSARRHRPSLKALALGDRLWPTETVFAGDPHPGATLDFIRLPFLLTTNIIELTN